MITIDNLIWWFFDLICIKKSTWRPFTWFDRFYSAIIPIKTVNFAISSFKLTSFNLDRLDFPKFGNLMHIIMSLKCSLTSLYTIDFDDTFLLLHYFNRFRRVNSKRLWLFDFFEQLLVIGLTYLFIIWTFSTAWL